MVTIQHRSSLSVNAIQKALEAAGFEIFDEEHSVEGGNAASQIESSELGYLDRYFISISRFSGKSRASDVNTKTRNCHLQNCEVCRLEAAGLSKPSRESVGSHNAPGSSSKAQPLVAVDSDSSQGRYRASLAIGGMTCASCVGTIKAELEKKDWVKEVVVNLISNSATVEYVGEEHKDDLVESIEDIGYDATIDNVVDLKPVEAVKAQSSHRRIEIQLNGMYCNHCPDRVKTSLEKFGNRVEIEKAASLDDSILIVNYTPAVPQFTIRDILGAISTADPAIQPSIYHPPTLEEKSRQIHAREQLRILIRVLLTLIIAIPTLIIGIIFMSLVSSSNGGRQFLMQPLRAGVSQAQWALFILATPVYFLCADVFHIRALKELRSLWRPGSTTPIYQRFLRFGSMNMLMSIGTSIAYISSVAQLIASGVNPPMMPDESSFYFDSVVFLTLFLLIGRLIEAYSKSKTGDAITMLGKLRPTEALLVDTKDPSSQDLGKDLSERVHGTDEISGETYVSVNADLLEFGDIVRVQHGQSPPCDGTLIRGETKFDESSLTGESKLVKKTVGDELFSGTVNKESSVSMKITGLAGSSMLDQIVKAVREGQTKRAPMERIADKLTSIFVPFVTYLAIIVWIIWLSLGLSGTLSEDYLGAESGGWVAWSLQFSIAVFVVACPCGLGLAAPTALFVGGGLAAKYGILVKGGGAAFEAASKIDCVVFDKTGTLTVGGEPVVTDYESVDSEAGSDLKNEEFILQMVNSMESNSSHSIAKALVSFCKSKAVNSLSIENVEEIPGQGLKGKHGQMELIIGNEHMLCEYRIQIPSSTQSILDAWKQEGKSVALAASRTADTAWQLSAIFAISDPVRSESRGIIQALQKRGTDVWMLSGDNQITANAIGAQLGIHAENIIAGVLPSQKSEKIRYLQRSLKSKNASGTETQRRALVAMVGDGINDSPALTTADVGIAIGSGSDIAISSAEFVLVSSNLNALITLLDLSKFVFRRIKFNLAWALVYNMIALPVAAGAFYPIVSGGKHVRLDPVWASLAMAASSISVVLSSLALRSRVPGLGFKVKAPVAEDEAVV